MAEKFFWGRGHCFSWEIFLWEGSANIPHNRIKPFQRSMSSYTVNENNVSSAVRDILTETQSDKLIDNMLLLYKRVGRFWTFLSETIAGTLFLQV